ncbi:MAG: hypothetical protein WD844_14715 [Thermoleophilaceae bacterium]
MLDPADVMAQHATPIPSDDLKRIREISQAIFGAKHRLPMAVVIDSAPACELYAEALAEPAGTTTVQAGAELKHFAKAGLLDPLPEKRERGRRGRPPKRYAKRRSTIWKLARKLAEEG